jgi:hypothetical protein
MRTPAKSRTPDLNLTPVLGLVAILIPLLLMAYAPHVLAVIDSEPPSLCGASCAASTDDLVTPRVVVTGRGLVLENVVVTSGEPVTRQEVPCEGQCRSVDDYDWQTLQQTLARTRAETDGTGQVTILPAEDASYELLVETMDACREWRHDDGTVEPLYPRPTFGTLAEAVAPIPS